MNSHGPDGQQVVWAVVGTDIGPLLLAATRDGLVNVVFHASDAVRDKALDRLASRLGSAPVEAPDSPLLAEAIRQVEAYFAGTRRDFDLALDWSLISGFNRQVLRELNSGVPFGSVVGYGDLAAGSASRARRRPSGWRWARTRCRSWCPVTAWSSATAGSAGSGAVWRPSGSCWPWRGSPRAAVLTPPSPLSPC